MLSSIAKMYPGAHVTESNNNSLTRQGITSNPGTRAETVPRNSTQAASTLILHQELLSKSCYLGQRTADKTVQNSTISSTP